MLEGTRYVLLIDMYNAALRKTYRRRQGLRYHERQGREGEGNSVREEGTSRRSLTKQLKVRASNMHMAFTRTYWGVHHVRDEAE